MKKAFMCVLLRLFEKGIYFAMLNPRPISTSLRMQTRIVLALLLAVSLLFSGCSGSAEASKMKGNSGPEASSAPNTEPAKPASAAGRFMYHDYSTGVKPTDPNKIDCGTKIVALTFDDGPNGDTVEFINELNELDVNCTFFMQGYMIENHPEAVTAMVSGGHQIGNHTYNHPDLAKLGDNDAHAQIMDTEALLKEIDGKNGHYIRCPYGNSSDYVSSIAPSPLIYWSLDTEDWSSRDADAVYNMIVNNVYDGAIILCHDIYESTRQGALRAIKTLQKQGYEFVTVEELFKRRGIEAENGTTYFDATNEGINLPAESVDLEFGKFSADKQPAATATPEATAAPESADPSADKDDPAAPADV